MQKLANDVDVALLPANTVAAAATRVIANLLVATDTQPAWRVMGDGRQDWGVGGTTAPDTSEYRVGAGKLRIDNALGISVAPSFPLHVMGAGSPPANWATYDPAGANQAGVIAAHCAAGAAGGGVVFGDGHGIFAAIGSMIQNGGPNPVGDLVVSSRKAIADAAFVERMRFTSGGGPSVWVGASGQTGVGLYCYGDVCANYGNASAQVYISTAGSIDFGASRDTSWYRQSASVLTSNGSINLPSSQRYSFNNDAWIERTLYVGYQAIHAYYMLTATGRVVADVGTAQETRLGYVDANATSGITFGSAADTYLFRGIAGVVATDGALAAQWSNTARVTVGDNSSAARIIFGSAGDTTLSRLGASILGTNSQFYSQPAANVDGFIYNPAGSSYGGYALTAKVQGATYPTWRVRADGYMEWGGGTAAADTNLSRIGNGAIGVVGGFYVTSVPQGIAYCYNPSAAPSGSTILLTSVQVASQPMFSIYADGVHRWGPGGGTGVDTSMYRTGANQLGTDGEFWLGRGAAASRLLFGTGDAFIKRTNTNQLATQGDWIVGQGQDTTGAGSRLYFGASASVWLYAVSLGVLRTDGRFSVAGMDVQRQPYGAQHHMEANASFLAAHGSGSVTFVSPFNTSLPTFALGTNASDGAPYADTISATGMTIYNQSAFAHNTSWIAEGP
jgi:hypothetical protein